MLEKNEEIRVFSNETTMIADDLSVNKIEDAVTVVPGKRKAFLSIIGVIFCEKLAHHQLFSIKKFD